MKSRGTYVCRHCAAGPSRLDRNQSDTDSRRSLGFLCCYWLDRSCSQQVLTRL